MTVYQVKVTLQYIDPPVWRRIQVPGDIKLGRLHRVLQAVMGWEDCHLHQFVAGDIMYGTPDPTFPDEIRSERNVRLDKIASAGDALIYEYDFGDGWIHRLEIEKTLAPEPKVRYPRCLDGARACPPEDSGGPPGYENLLEILQDPGHEEFEETCEWAGDDFDPEAFDVDSVNRTLKRIAR